jgi:hypothetical protein
MKGYLRSSTNAVKRYFVENSDVSAFTFQEFDLLDTYDDIIQEGSAQVITEIFGPVVLVYYVAVSLYYCTVATFGYEFVTAKKVVDQVVDINSTLLYFVVPIKVQSSMFGDNQS